MLDITEEACRVSRGLVLWVCAGAVRNYCYQPGPEGLLYEWWKRGGMTWRPAYWYRSGIPGSGHQHWLRADVEYVLSFIGPDRRPRRGRSMTNTTYKDWGAGSFTEIDKKGRFRKRDITNRKALDACVGEPAPDDPNTFWTNNTAMGHPPKWAPGGNSTNRCSDGSRVDRPYPVPIIANPGNLVETESFWVDNKAMGKPPKLAFHNGDYRCRTQDGKVCKQMYDAPDISNPGNLIKTNNGYGNIGSSLAHENEAPFSEKLAEFFIKTACPPEGLVLDPFSGSGTTVSVALMNGRRGIGLDIRRSQCELGFRRIADNQRPKSDLDPKQIKPLPGQLSLF